MLDNIPPYIQKAFENHDYPLLMDHLNCDATVLDTIFSLPFENAISIIKDSLIVEINQQMLNGKINRLKRKELEDKLIQNLLKHEAPFQLFEDIFGFHHRQYINQCAFFSYTPKKGRPATLSDSELLYIENLAKDIDFRGSSEQISNALIRISKTTGISIKRFYRHVKALNHG